MASSRADASPGGASFGPAPEWVFFTCDARRLALPLMRVRAILPPRPFTRLPGCGPGVCGLIGQRGRIITAFDLGVVLGLRSSAAVPDHRLLLVRCAGRMVAGVVDAVSTVASARVRPVKRRGKTMKGLALEREDVIGIGELDKEAFVALDPDRVLGALLA
ncbi:MAG TPA: chemotaxis protein CheW [Longimicrobiales bacterium]